MQKERSVLYDNVKFFLICCVVLGHLGNRYADKSYIIACAQFWIYLFHMPAFVFISGIFSKRAVKERKWNKAIPYIFLFFAMKVFSFGLAVYTKGVDKATIDFFHENGVPWFALSMFWWYAVTILIQNVHPNYVLIVSIVLSLISGYSTDVNSLFVMQRTIIFYPFFYAGYLTDPIKLQTVLQKWKIRIAGAAIILVTIALSFLYFHEIYYWRFLFRGIKAYSQIHEGLPYAWGWIWRMTAYFISFVLTLAIISITPDVKCFISNIGKRTLSIYVFHNIFISLVLSKMGFFKKWLTQKHLSLHCIIFMLIIVLVTSLKPFDWITRKILNVPPKKDFP